MQKLRPLGWAAYAVAFLLIIWPALDTIVNVLPPRPGDIRWRFAAVGLTSRALLTPAFGMLLALSTTALLEHKRTARVLAILSFAGAVLSLAAVVIFALDAIQARGNVRAEVLTAYDTTTGLTVVKFLLAAATAVLLGIAGWKAGRRPAAGRPAGREMVPEPGTKSDARVLIGSQRE